MKSFLYHRISLSDFPYVPVSLVNNKLESCGGKKSLSRKCPPPQICLWYVFAITEWCRRAQTTVGRVTPRQVVLSKSWEQVSEQHSSVASDQVPASGFLPWLPSDLQALRWNKPFPPRIALDHGVLSQQQKPPRRYITPNAVDILLTRLFSTFLPFSFWVIIHSLHCVACGLLHILR